MINKKVQGSLINHLTAQGCIMAADTSVPEVGQQLLRWPPLHDTLHLRY